MTSETPTGAAMGAIARASKEWTSSLIDVGGNNGLLYFKQTSSVIDLTNAEGTAYQRLLEGKQVRLESLFRQPTDLVQAEKACLKLQRRQREATEEYGVSVTYLAVGFASWSTDGNETANTAAETTIGKRSTTPPNAPVLLRSLQIERRRGAQDSWMLTLTDDFQLNSVLLHVLRHGGTPVDEELLLDALELGAGACLQRLVEACMNIKGFTMDNSSVLGVFSYQKQPMVRDVENIAALATSDLVTALAGDQATANRVRSAAPQLAVNESDPDYAPIDSEYLVLDADASQSYVVNATLAGRNLVVQGPPGTGKSQTIANVIASLMAQGKHVLFVAQKRAAITAVLDRLAQVDLTHLLLDLFAADGSRRFVAEQVNAALERQGHTAEPDVAMLHHTLARTRDQLVRHKDALFSATRGWGVSVQELRLVAQTIPDRARVPFRLPASTFTTWQPTTLDALVAAVNELQTLGALHPEWAHKPGWAPAALTSSAMAQSLREKTLQAIAQVSAVSQQLPVLGTMAGYGPPQTLAQAEWLVQFFGDIAALDRQAPGLITAPDMEAMLAAVSRKHRAGIARATRREGKRRVREMLNGLPRKQRRDTLLRAQSLQAAWKGSAQPAVLDVHASAELVTSARALLTELAGASQGLNLLQASFETITRQLQNLTDPQPAALMVRANELARQLFDAGLGPAWSLFSSPRIAEPHAGERIADDLKVGEVLRWIVIRSILDDAELKSPELVSLQGSDLDATGQLFRKADVTHLQANAARVRREAAEHFKQVIDAHTDEYSLLKTEVTRKRNCRPVRRLLEEAPHTLLAAKPVWAMSPLQVSRLLPATSCFDVVIFDEASQVKPADAIPALLRGRQALIAGDSHQLPPTEFFTKVLEDDDATEEDDSAPLTSSQQPSDQPAPASSGSFTRDAESILFAMDRLLAGESRSLQWHYRSRDERLIAVSNRHVYANSLTTFPAADAPDSLRHVEVPPSAGISGTFNSPEDEVTRVVELVREQVFDHPGESIGIIAFGIKHQARIEKALEQAMLDDPQFERALNTHTDEPWFVKSIERVQGDERDAIILTVGYGKSLDGKLRYFWGPLLREGGERRLNVAISRAKKRLTLVTSFSAADVPENGHPSAGFALMYHFLQFVSSQSKQVDGPSLPARPFNTFESDVKQRLEAAGLVLDCQLGVGEYRIDFAVRHPDKPGCHVLAIEADGAAYCSGQTARERSRLRRSALEQRGWRFHRLWTADWFHDPDAEVAKVLDAFHDAVAAPAGQPSQEPWAGTDSQPAGLEMAWLPPEQADGVEHQAESDAGALLINRALADEAQAATSRSDLTSPTWSEGAVGRQLPRPEIPRYQSITDYSHAELVALTRYVRSDTLIRSTDEEQRLIMAELGFSRRGARIAEALARAQEECDRLG